MSAKKTPSRPSAGKAPPDTDKPTKRRPDWEAIERDYRTAKFTLRELGAAHGVSHQAIGKQAKTNGWTQDLALQIRQATNAKLVAELVAKEVASGGQAVANVVLVAAEVAKGVILGQRSRVGRATGVALRMLDELDATTTQDGEIRKLFEVLTDDLDDAGKAQAQQQLRDFLKLHTRVASVHKLMDTLAKAQAMERQAFNIDGDDRGKDGDETLTDDSLRRKLARLGIAVHVPTVIDV